LLDSRFDNLPTNLTKYYKEDLRKNDTAYYFNKFDDYDKFVRDKDTYDEYDPVSGLVIRHAPRKEGNIEAIGPAVLLLLGLAFVGSVCLTGVIKICMINKVATTQDKLVNAAVKVLTDRVVACYQGKNETETDLLQAEPLRLDANLGTSSKLRDQDNDNLA